MSETRSAEQSVSGPQSSIPEKSSGPMNATIGKNQATAQEATEEKDSDKESAHPGSAERKYPRISLPNGMLVAWYGGGGHEISRVATLGMGGLFITTANPPPVGSNLRLAFEVPGGEVQIEAIVRNVAPGQGMGLEFKRMGLSTRLRLRELLRRLLR